MDSTSLAGHEPTTYHLPPEAGTPTTPIETAQPSTNPQEKSMLLTGIPRELRDLIWEYTLIEPEDIVVPSPQYNTSKAILTLCHQVLDEGAPIMFSQNIFRFQILNSKTSRYPLKLTSALPAQMLENISKIKLEIDIGAEFEKLSVLDAHGRKKIGRPFMSQDEWIRYERVSRRLGEFLKFVAEQFEDVGVVEVEAVDVGIDPRPNAECKVRLDGYMERVRMDIDTPLPTRLAWGMEATHR